MAMSDTGKPAVERSRYPGQVRERWGISSHPPFCDFGDFIRSWLCRSAVTVSVSACTALHALIQIMPTALVYAA